MQYIVYKTTNKKNGRFYIGFHRTKDYRVFDGYLGSGSVLAHAIRKYGRENFERQTLVVFSNVDDALNFERDYLTMIDYANDKKCYNVCAGGRELGTWSVANKVGVHGASKEQLAEWGRKSVVEHKKRNSRFVDRPHAERSIEAKERHSKIDPSIRKANASYAGKFGGDKCSKEKIGFHAMTHEEMSARSKRTVSKQTPEQQDAQGKLMGRKNKGSFVYNDGTKTYRYTVEEQQVLSFAEFIMTNQQYTKGFVKRKPK